MQPAVCAELQGYTIGDQQMTLVTHGPNRNHIASINRIAAVVGKKDPLTRRVASVLSRHAYAVVQHRSLKDALHEIYSVVNLPSGGSTPAAMYSDALRGASVIDYPTLMILNFDGFRGGIGKTGWLAALKEFTGLMPRTAVLAAIGDDNAPDLIKGAIEAGADEILRGRDAEFDDLIWLRVQSALAKADAAPEATPAVDFVRFTGVERRVAERRQEDRREGAAAQRADVTEEWDEPTPTHEVRAAQERVRTMAAQLPDAESRRGPLADLLGVAVPALRADSGRLDAKKIADALGVSLTRLAKVAPISRQALNDTPDSARAQGALDPVARILDVLGTVLPQGQIRGWLNTPHPRLGGATPLDEILAGRAEPVARMLELAREGGVD